MALFYSSDLHIYTSKSSDISDHFYITKYTSDGQVKVENQESNPVELSYLVNHVAVTQDEFESNDYTLSVLAKELIEALNKEDISLLQKEDLERIQNLLDQYKSLPDEDKDLIPEETRNKVAALTKWLNKMNDTATPSDPSGSESPADPGTQEIPSDSSGSQATEVKDPVSTPGLIDQNVNQNITAVSQGISQKIEPTYHMAPGTGISDNTIIGWIIMLTASIAAVTIVWFSKQKNDFKN